MAEIKISELSIGDWVYQKMNDDAYQVQWIEREMVGLIKHTGTEEDGSIRLTAVPLSFIEPIPLTPEILEKNGFRKNGNKWYTPELFTLERWGDNWSIVIACSCGEYACEVCTIKYVHQLQHALRLAGVEKKIEL